MRVLIVMMIVAGCSKSGDKAKSECGAAVERGVDATIAKRRAGNTQPLTPEERDVPKKLKVALDKACTDDKWSKEVIECFKTAADIATCKAMLTPEQRASYTRAAMGVMMQGKGGMPPHGMPAPAPSEPGSGSVLPPAGD